MKNDLDRPLRASKRMREEGYFKDPNKMTNQDLVDECIALGAAIAIGKSSVDPAGYYLVAEDILSCIEMSMADTDIIHSLMDRCFEMFEDNFFGPIDEAAAKYYGKAVSEE